MWNSTREHAPAPDHSRQDDLGHSDYGRFDRREAPQFYPDVKGAETKHPEPAH
jgi:hypothetical protein